ncbi:MAG TPA: PIG-L family deacetylase [bacterium]|nr:PIG-L family deacetylase [bacterium]
MKRNILVIGAHIDDCEGGSCAGISLKFIKLGYKVYFLNTIGNLKSWSIVKDKKTEEALIQEAYKAAEILGTHKILLKFQHNHLFDMDFNVIKEIAKVIKKINPEIILIPWPKDNHPDHVRTAKASLEAISYFNINSSLGGKTSIKVNLKEILAYEISSWQTENFKPDFFINITNEMEIVCQSMKAFKHIGTKLYIKDKKAQCSLWGIQAEFKYAEGFKHLGPYFPINSILLALFGKDLRPAGFLQYPWGIRL